MSLPQTVRAIGYTENGPASVLKEGTIPLPELLPKDVLVKLRAVAVNPVDFKLRKGIPGLGPKGFTVLGYDGAGEVVQVGSEASKFKVGDEVYFAGDLLRQGSNAEYLAIDERIIALKPKSLSWEQAAAEPLTALTAIESLFEELLLAENNDSEAGKVLLIVNGAGGVGSSAIALAKALTKVTVVATASRPETQAYVKELGADHVISHYENYASQLQAIGIDKINYVIDAADITSDRINQLLHLLKPFGRYVMLASIKEPVPIDTNPIVFNRLALLGEIMYARKVVDNEPERQGAWLARLAGLLDSGALKPRKITVLDFWTQLGEAHQALESGKTLGKIVLKL